MPVTVTAVDLSTPASPAINAVMWVDGQGDAVTDVAAVAGAQLQLSAPSTTAQVLLQRRRDDAVGWTNAPLDGKRGWQVWDTDAAKGARLDTTARPHQRWHYRARLRTADRRQSNWSATVTLEPLT